MTPLDLQFRLDDLQEDPREFRGRIAIEALDEVLKGMIGELGFRAQGPAVIQGSVYRVRRDVFIEAEIEVTVGYDCVRCLDPLTIKFECKVRHLLVPGKREATPAGEVAVDTEDSADAGDDLDCYEGDTIDLVPILREDILLEMPMNPTCVESQGAACARFDQVLSAVTATPEPEPEPAIDPRWAPLLELKKKLS
jgi:uncharacterized protein